MLLKKISVEKLKTAKYNPRKDLCKNDPEYQSIKNSIDRYGYIDPIIWNEKTGNIVGGHQRLKILKEQGLNEVDVVVVDYDEDTEKTCNIALNKVSGHWDAEKLNDLLNDLKQKKVDVQSLGIEQEWIDNIFGIRSQREEYEKSKGSLSNRFIFPPFSILDARTSIWQDRKKIWQKILRSEKGRDLDLIGGFRQIAKKHSIKQGGTSIFDPVLCELLIQWFCPVNGKILDPFAGGSVRGMISSFLDRSYTGIDLSKKQVEANYETSKQFDGSDNLFGKKLNLPHWINDDSRNIPNLDLNEFDFILTCPPYGDLEQYSKDPNDLSNLPYESFKDDYRDIINKSCNKLKNDSFAAIVVGEIRDKNGFYRSFVPDTIRAFCDAGLNYYNEAVLITMLSTLVLRTGSQFSKSRKFGKTHQNVLIFAKGNPVVKKFESRRELTATHKNVLVFVKGEPKEATLKLDHSIDNLLPEVL